MPRRREFVAALGGSAVVTLSGCQGLRLPGTVDPKLQVPTESAMGEPFRVEVAGAPPGREVAVEVTARDARDRQFEASFPAAADDEGTAVATAATVATDDGDSEGEDGPFDATRTDASSAERISVGLGGSGPPRMPLAEMEPPSEAASTRQFVARADSETLDRVDVSVSARIDGTNLGASTTRTLVDETVSRRKVQRDDLVGWVHEPGADDPLPGVLLLHGSAARVLHRYARMLASNGFSVLALQYFDATGLPPTLDDVPLEYFERAVAYLLGRDAVVDGRVGLVGLSRGVEPALLTAAAFDGPASVVGHSGSGLVVPGLDESRAVASYEAAWTRDGEPIVPATPIQRLLPTVPEAATDASDLESAVDALESHEASERVAIPVEGIDGPVLLLSGQQDALWNGPVLSEYAVSRLAAHDHSRPFAHVTYDGAGHVFVEPYLDAGFVTGPRFGGTSAGYASAAADAHVRCLDYLRYGLATG